MSGGSIDKVLKCYIEEAKQVKNKLEELIKRVEYEQNGKARSCKKDDKPLIRLRRIKVKARNKRA